MKTKEIKGRVIDILDYADGKHILILLDNENMADNLKGEEIVTAEVDEE